MSTPDDLRLIEDYLPIEGISAEASREKSVRKGHISTLHLWWARRPLVACRAAVYGALVPADRWVKDINVQNANGKDVTAFKASTKRGLNRKAAKDFVSKLCRYPKTKPTKPADIKLKRETEAAIVEAQRHILEAHADRLTAELAAANESGKPPAWVEEFKFTGDNVSYDDIVTGRAPRPRVLDMFAGGGAIPLEALRLGCEAYALDLNPVAHIIQLCTLVYPQKYGKPDPTARGMTGPKNDKDEATWGGLAAEVRYWGSWVLDRVRKEIGDLYPPIPDPAVWKTPPEIAFDRETGYWTVTKAGKLRRGVKLDDPSAGSTTQREMYEEEGEDTEDEVAVPLGSLLPGFLRPVAYLWTRTVRCKNPGCAATVPLVRQTWLCKKAKRCAALKMTAARGAKQVSFKVIESENQDGLGFDPSAFSTGGNATCPFCGAVADADYTQSQGMSGNAGSQPMAVVCRKPRGGLVFFSPDEVPNRSIFDSEFIIDRVHQIETISGILRPNERISETRPSPNARGLTAPTRHGLMTFADLFHPRQLLSLLTQCASVRLADAALRKNDVSTEHTQVILSYLAIVVDRMADRGSSLCRWDPAYTKTQSTFGRPALPFVWDFSETNPFGDASGDMRQASDWVTAVITSSSDVGPPASVVRGSALSLGYSDSQMDAVITDPPYYDNVPYADVSDYFYVWLKRSIGHLFPEHFTAEQTPKKGEATALSSRHSGSMEVASRAYEQMMAEAFAQAHRVLKPAGEFIVVYAHKTTLGWSTLVEALRKAGFIVTEAWPLDTEFGGRLIALDAAALASSIFLVARKRDMQTGVGNYEDDVQPELQQIVSERVDTLWDMGIAGADLVIACVGAGLRAFTKYEKVEYANGEEVPAEKFLAEVEGAVLDRMMVKLFGQAGSVSAIDPASRFYILWRFVYKVTEIEAGEAIVFTYAQHVELDGPLGLSTGTDALVEKKKAKYRARDFTERGNNDKLGQPTDDGKPVPLIDALHRILWLMENSPRKLAEFLNEAGPDRERLRVLAQALAGAALSGKTEADADKLIGTTAAEKSALGKLLANWRSVIENVVESREDRADRKSGQQRLFE